MDTVEDYLKFIVTNDGIEISNKSRTESARYTIPKDELEISIIGENEEFENKYKLGYIRQIAKLLKNEVEIKIGNDTPIKISYKMAEGSGIVFFIIASQFDES